MKVDEAYIVKNNKKLRYGYTTGTCAAAAAKAACILLFEGSAPGYVDIKTPSGVTISPEVFFASYENGSASCAVKKDAGDDPDATDGIFIYARAERLKNEECPLEDTSGPTVLIDGGEGIGRVTLPGLEQPVGSAAINSVPRRMITEAALEVCSAHSYTGQINITISAPGGEDIAKKTYNPRLGIVGGISILGTTGIVEPMSEKAMIDAIGVELNVIKAGGCNTVVMIPGNYGAAFARDTLGIDVQKALKCSNYIGESLDLAVTAGIPNVLLVGHIGKLIKLSGGIMNTHSRNADCRMELLCAAVLRAGCGSELALRVLGALTAEEAVRIIDESGVLESVMASVMERIEFHLSQRTKGALNAQAVTFSSNLGLLGMTSGAQKLIDGL